MLTYAGYPLLLPDPDSELSRWLRLNQDVADLVEFGADPLGCVSPRRGLLSWGGDRKGIGQAVANYAAPPPPRLNSLYWPTGATRWARGYFLATETQKNKIVEQAHSSTANAPLKLVWGDKDDKTPLEASLYLLPPRPVSAVGRNYDSAEALWILPLVDHRYWWQFKITDDLEIDDETSWADLFETLGTALGIAVSLPTAVNSAYLSPDPYEFTRRFENAAMMLDAAALSVGKRIVRRIDGTVRAESVDDADSVLVANRKKNYRIVAGRNGRASARNSDREKGYRPAKVLVTFRKWRHYRLLQKGQVYTVEKDPSDTSAVVTGTQKVFHSTLVADYSSDTSPPANTSDMDALADKIASDYYSWFQRRYDATYNGAQPWIPTGYCDSIVWDFGRPQDGERLAQTRVQSMPVDFGFDLQLSQDPAKTLLESPVLGKIDASISKDARGTVHVYQGRSASRTDSGIEIEACASAMALTDTDKMVAASWVDDDWEVGPWECQ